MNKVYCDKIVVFTHLMYARSDRPPTNVASARHSTPSLLEPNTVPTQSRATLNRKLVVAVRALSPLNPHH
ncbi:hypothetical protein DEO72_LG2g1882 [Vigna unguiculata]|uniref:Uncharacterized protein n=1 Tax=Vigna unguiculata TaxID=3917 RepID=A0A4D6KXT5_VIGUN|nr:hypothetical protein DEO72_LG2g1882 [Vigna unguiculata]